MGAQHITQAGYFGRVQITNPYTIGQLGAPVDRPHAYLPFLEVLGRIGHAIFTDSDLIKPGRRAIRRSRSFRHPDKDEIALGNGKLRDIYGQIGPGSLIYAPSPDIKVVTVAPGDSFFSAPDIILYAENHHSAIGISKANRHPDSLGQGFFGISPAFEVEDIGFQVIGMDIINSVKQTENNFW